MGRARECWQQATVSGAILSLVAITSTTPLGQSTPDAKYKELLAKLRGGDTTIDFGEIRTAYAESSQYVSDTDSDLRKEMFSALQKKDYVDAANAANKALADYYPDLDAHQVLYITCRETNQSEQASYHRAVVKGLLGALLSTGDGKSEKTAYVVNSTREEYIVLELKGLMPNQQSLSRSDGHSYDVMVGIDPQSKEKVSLHFNIDRTMGALEKALKQR